MTSLLLKPPLSRGACSFGTVHYHTVLSNAAELAPFGKAFERERQRCSAEQPPPPKLTTLDEVFAVVSRAHGPVLGARSFNLSSTNKYWYQNVKKLYGCVALSSEWCFVANAEVYLLQHSVCHIATSYANKRTVFMSRANETQAGMLLDVARSSQRMLAAQLGSGRGGGAKASLFGAMEAYSWMWPAYLLREFALGDEGLAGRAVQIARDRVLPGSTKAASLGHAFIEDTIYKFILVRSAGTAGFLFVDARAELIAATGEAAWAAMANHNAARLGLTRPSQGQEGFLLSTACRHVHTAPSPRLAALAIARMQRRHGVLITQCVDTAACRTMAEQLDMCVSNGVQPAY